MHRPSAFASRLEEAAFFALAVGFPVLAVLAPLGVVPLVLAAAVSALVAALLSGEIPSRPDRPIAVGALLLAAWALLSALWAVDPWRSLETWLRLVPTVAAGGFLLLQAGRQPIERRRRHGGWLLAGFLLALALMVVEGLGNREITYYLAGLLDQAPEQGFPLTRLNRGATTLAILAWPAAAVVAGMLPQRRKAAALLLPLALTALLSCYGSLAAVYGCGLGLLAAALSLPRPRLARQVVLAGTALLLLAMPLLATGLSGLGLAEDKTVDSSVRHRIFIWDFAAGKIAEKPLAGWGLDSSRVLSGSGAPRFEGTLSPLPLHPHNAALQVWLELGAVGVLPGGALLLLALGRLRRAPPLAAALDSGMAVSFLVVGFVSYGIWQYHWLVVPMAAAALMRWGAPDKA